MYKCTVGTFSIGDAFDAMDLLFEQSYLSVSCVEKDEQWFIELLSEHSIEESVVCEILNKYRCDSISIENVKETDWLKKCFENFKPIVIGNFFVYGTHLRSNSVPKDKIAIEIAAATAFGTGEHPTTHNCLLACQAYFDNKIHEKTLDIGCGSCILSIALAKLGAKNVTACDCDPEAVKVSIENTKNNNVAHKINVFQNVSNEFDFEQYDFIVSNILSEPLIQMSDSIKKSLKQRGILVLSGFNTDDKSVQEKYTQLGLSIKYIYEKDGWSTIVFQND